MAEPIPVPAGTTDDAVSQAADRVSTRSYGDDAAISGAATWLRAHLRGEPQTPPDRDMREWIDKIVVELSVMSADPQWASLFTAATTVSMATPGGATTGDPTTLPPVGEPSAQVPPTSGAAAPPAQQQPASADGPTQAATGGPEGGEPGDGAFGTIALYDDEEDDGPEIVVRGNRAYFGRLSPGCLTLIALVALVLGAVVVLVVVNSGGTSSSTRGSSSPVASGYTCHGTEFELYNNWTGEAVSNGATSPTISTDGKPYCLVEIATYHWNNGNGTSAGTLTLVGGMGSGAQKLGPYPAEPTAGQAPNVNLVATVPTSPAPVIIDGSYTVEDSEPSTWSQSGGAGFVRIWAIPAVRNS